MRLFHRRRSLEVGDGARHPQHPVIPARAQPEAGRDLAHQLRRAFGEGNDRLEEVALRIGIDRHPLVPGKSVALHRPRLRHPRADAGAGLADARQAEKSSTVTAGTSMRRSKRSISGPEMRPRYSAPHSGTRAQARPGSARWPQRQGLAAATSMKRQG